MANIPLKSIKFPGLDDTYTFLQDDDTLTVPGAAADAKKTGDEIADIRETMVTSVNGQTGDVTVVPATDTQVKNAVDEYLEEHPTIGGSFSNAAKRALLSLLAKVAYIDEDGQEYLDTLEQELFTVAVASITAVYTQSGTVYDIDDLDSLRDDLVVTANYANGTSEAVTAYTLSGTLTEGTSTITVSYSEKTAEFHVTVTSASYVSDGLIMWLDGERNGVGGAHETALTTWVDQSGNGWDWTNSNATAGDKSIVFNGSNSCLTREYQSLPDNVAMMEVVLRGTRGGCIITGFGRNKIGNVNIATTSDFMNFHIGIGTEQTSNAAFHIGTDGAMDNKICSVNSAGYLNGEQIETAGTSSDWQYQYPAIGLYRGSGGNGAQYIFQGEIYCIRMYSRILTEAEILENYAIDSRRFGIGG